MNRTLLPLGLLGAVLVLVNGAIAQVAFAPATNYPVSTYPRAIAAADINGDGKMDLIVANEFANSLLVLTNDGNGGFGSNATYNVQNPSFVMAADVNNDSKPDLISADEDVGQLSVLTNNGNGGFVLASTPTLGVSLPAWVTTADINGDGKPDLICAEWQNSTIQVFTNVGGGDFVYKARYGVGSFNSQIASVMAADVNGDDKVDLVTANQRANALYVLTNNGNGGFVASASYTVGSRPRSCIPVDVNGDGKVDLVCANSGGNTLSVLTNNGIGIFGSNATYTVGNNPYWVIAADVNGDGKIDLVSASEGNTLSVLTNNGAGIFVLAASPQVGDGGQASVTAADLNGDGHLDLISGNNSDNTISVVMSVPTPVLKPSAGNQLVSWPSSWTNWTLQQNSDLTTKNWISASGTLGDDGTTKTVTNSPALGAVFFRLTHP
jgi:hypothetical protein